MATAVGPLEGASARTFQHGTPDGRDGRVSAYRTYPRCPTDCTGCAPRTRSSGARLLVERPLQGGRLIVTSLCCFLTPLAAALGGVLFAGEGAVRQLVGAGGGLLGATALAAWIAGALRRRQRGTS